MTITLDDALYQQALALAGENLTPAELLNRTMATFVQVHSARRLAALGGEAPHMKNVARRRPPATRRLR